jgi:murein L,D-transpeptidase YafK
MKIFNTLALLLSAWTGVISPAYSQSSPSNSEEAGSVPAYLSRKPSTAILVDKKSNELQLMEYREGRYFPIKKYHVTLGKVKGDKELEGDLKTPEGIYTFKARLTPPSLKPKFGVMAFYVNYPNTYDELAGRTGFDIMLHATNEPERLKQNFDSEGCVVVNNNELKELEPHIRIGLTPILIFPELKSEFLSPGADPGLRQFFESWVKSWETRSIEDYISHYHSDFSANGMNKDRWKAYKANLNQVYQTITLGVEDARYYRHPKYSMVTFTQNYLSRTKSGGIGHKSRGTKVLYVAEENGIPKIIAESFSQVVW